MHPAQARTTEIFRHDFLRKQGDLWSKGGFSNMDPDEHQTKGPDLQIFSPGIRMPNESADDQQRVCEPMDSIINGADKIIMGRSLIKGNIEENIDKVSNSIKV